MQKATGAALVPYKPLLGSLAELGVGAGLRGAQKPRPEGVEPVKTRGGAQGGKGAGAQRAWGGVSEGGTGRTPTHPP